MHKQGSLNEPVYTITAFIQLFYLCCPEQLAYAMKDSLYFIFFYSDFGVYSGHANAQILKVLLQERFPDFKDSLETIFTRDAAISHMPRREFEHKVLKYFR